VLPSDSALNRNLYDATADGTGLAVVIGREDSGFGENHVRHPSLHSSRAHPINARITCLALEGLNVNPGNINRSP
jgi:hypothetical protein